MRLSAFRRRGRRGWNGAERAGSFALGMALSLCPRRHRFTAARRIAKILAPLMRLVSPNAQQLLPFDGFPEAALRSAYRSMMRLDLKFDPVLTIRGAEAIGPAGALIISGHFGLNGLFVRWLFDRGRRVSIVMFTPPERPRIVGTPTPFDVIGPDAMSLLHIRRRVAEGELVLIALDTAHVRAERFRVDSPGGTRYISDKAIRFAARAGIPILYCATQVASNGEVVTTVVCAASARGRHLR